MELSIEDQKSMITVVDGVWSTTHVFPFKGVCIIRASKTSEENKGEESRVTLRVVDYREELVSLFNSIFKKAGLIHPEVENELTAREFQGLLSTLYPTLSQSSLEEITSIFEIADYSIRRVGRPEYEGFYLAKIELERLIEDESSEN